MGREGEGRRVGGWTQIHMETKLMSEMTDSVIWQANRGSRFYLPCWAVPGDSLGVHSLPRQVVGSKCHQ